MRASTLNYVAALLGAAISVGFAMTQVHFSGLSVADAPALMLFFGIAAAPCAAALLYVEHEYRPGNWLRTGALILGIGTSIAISVSHFAGPPSPNGDDPLRVIAVAMYQTICLAVALALAQGVTIALARATSDSITNVR